MPTLRDRIRTTWRSSVGDGSVIDWSKRFVGDIYSGESQKALDLFIRQTETTFRTKPTIYSTDEDRCVFAGEYLGGTPAKDWHRLDKGTGIGCHVVDDHYLDYLVGCFGDLVASGFSIRPFDDDW